MKNSIRKTCLLLIVAVGICMPMAVFADGWVNDNNTPDWWDDSNINKYTVDDTEEEKSSNENDSTAINANEETSSNTTYEEDEGLSKDGISLLVTIALFIIVSVLEAISKNRTESARGSNAAPVAVKQQLPKYKPQTDIKKYLPHMTEERLVRDLVNKFISIEEAYMNFDYDKLHELCSNELYESYKQELETLKNQNCQSIMSDIKATTSRITQVYEENNQLIAKISLTIVSYDYVINTETKEIIEGNKEQREYNSYDLEFIYAITSSTGKCQNCGAEVKIDQEICNYCHAIIKTSYEDFVLAKVTKKEIDI